MGAALDSTDIVARAKQIHCATPLAAAALGRLLTAVSIMGDRLKEDNASITVRINGGGPIGSLIAVSDNHGNVRGYAQDPGVTLPAKNGKMDIAGAVGKEGQTTVMKDYGYGQPYAAQCPIVSGEIAGDLIGYYAISEQTPTIFLLGVSFDSARKVEYAGGLLLQLLPAADEREITKLEANLKNLPPITEMMKEGLTPSDILLRALAGCEVEFFEPEHPEYRCNCSKERVTKAVLTLGPDEIRKLAGDDGRAEVNCHFCDKKYYLTQDELDSLADSAAESRQ